MFKKGDKIRLKSGDYVPNENLSAPLVNNRDFCKHFGWDLNEIYTVVGADKDSISLEEKESWRMADRFELVDARYIDYHTALNAAEEAKEAFRVSIKQGDKFLWNDKPVTVDCVIRDYVIVRYDDSEVDIKYYATVEELRLRD